MQQGLPGATKLPGSVDPGESPCSEPSGSCRRADQQTRRRVIAGTGPQRTPKEES